MQPYLAQSPNCLHSHRLTSGTQFMVEWTNPQWRYSGGGTRTRNLMITGPNHYASQLYISVMNSLGVPVDAGIVFYIVMVAGKTTWSSIHHVQITCLSSAVTYLSCVAMNTSHSEKHLFPCNFMLKTSHFLVFKRNIQFENTPFFSISNFCLISYMQRAYKHGKKYDIELLLWYV